MQNAGRSALDQLLDLLTDEIARRLAARSAPQRSEPDSHVPSAAPVEPIANPSPMPERVAIAPPAPDASNREPEPVADALNLRHVPSTSLMGRLALGVLFLVILINIPINLQGTVLARSIPNTASLVIQNGLLVKEANSADVWVYRDGAFRWITSLELFQQLGYRWDNVHVVEPGYLSHFEKGDPLYLILKCPSSPHIYRIEDGRKRWIVDIPTFEAEGYVWRDVRFVSCAQLRNMPDGESIPAGRGLPPPPLP